MIWAGVVSAMVESVIAPSLSGVLRLAPVVSCGLVRTSGIAEPLTLHGVVEVTVSHTLGVLGPLVLLHVSDLIRTWWYVSRHRVSDEDAHEQHGQEQPHGDCHDGVPLTSGQGASGRIHGLNVPS